VKSTSLSVRSLGLGLVGACLLAMAPVSASAAGGAACAKDNAGLTLPKGFCATVFADKLGQPRHMAVAADGTLYVNSWLSPFRPGLEAPKDGYIIALRDTNGDGVADVQHRFGQNASDPDAIGGTGIALYKGYLYAVETGKIVRYRLDPGQMMPKGPPQVVLSGLSTTGDHAMHSFLISKDGALIVNSGSATNSCQVNDRVPGSPGQDPCPELSTRAGIWKYDANKLNQKFSPKERYVSNIRNSMAIAFDAKGDLYDVPHGRDQLHANWPKIYNVEQGAELPAEKFLKIKAGASYDWPYCYYDEFQKKYVQAPEYGGDGKKTDRCKNIPAPLTAYPGHWAPDDLLFYTGTAFPERYRRGAFIAFHGSWNRPKAEGYDVVFQPFGASGKPEGKFEVFADGFAGADKSSAGAAHRPTGLAMGPDGALYVSDDQGGRIYRIIHR
jgi:glucose/arabinose dehydrogenase